VKARVALATLDGSYFHRLIEHHGSFATMLDGPSPAWALPWAFAAGLAWIAFRSLRGGADARLARFLLVAWAVTQAGLLATPAADRVHHALNVYPLPHLAVVAAAAWAWRAVPAAASGRAVHALLVAAGLALLGSGAWTIDRTADLVERTGGRGLWSDASTRLAHELDRDGTTLVCLDWGFHQTLAFQTERAQLLDPVWRLRFARQQGRRWEMRGGEEHVYLLHAAPVDVTGFREPFLAAMGDLDPEQVEIRRWADREGEPALLSVRVRRPHALVWHDGFELRPR
jgi:hypothetical protein